MSDTWDSYLCNVNGSVASVFVDVGLKNVASDKTRDYVAWLLVTMRAPRPDGLSSQEEFAKLMALEDHLETKHPEGDVLFVGRITTQGRREFYFYVPADEGFEEWAKNVMSAFPEYEFETGTQADPEMRQYLDVLYPSVAQTQKGKNLKVLAALEKAGDALDQPREVDHFACFRGQTQRDEFATWAQDQGFKATVSETPGKPMPWGVALSKAHNVDAPSIDAITIDLAERCAALAGDYDGWGCPVVRPAKPRSLWNRLTGKV